MTKAPCKECEDRKITDNYNCHDDCIRYKEFKHKREKENTLIREIKGIEV